MGLLDLPEALQTQRGASEVSFRVRATDSFLVPGCALAVEGLITHDQRGRDG